MNLMGYCTRCGRHFNGPDEGCPACDKDNPHVTSAGNWFADADEVATFGCLEPEDTPEPGLGNIAPEDSLMGTRADLKALIGEEELARVEEAVKQYPDAHMLQFLDLKPLRPDHHDRVIEPYPLHGGGMSQRVEYTHTFKVKYHRCGWQTLYGVTTEGKAHLWAD